jgi:MFS family permease
VIPSVISLDTTDFDRLIHILVTGLQFMVYHVSLWILSLRQQHSLTYSLALNQSAINTVQFTGRTGALASLVSGVGSAGGGFITGHLLDRKNFSRRKCGMVGLVFVAATMWITWIGGVVNQTNVRKEST